MRNPFYNDMIPGLKAYECHAGTAICDLCPHMMLFEHSGRMEMTMKVLQEGILADFLNRFMDLILLNVLWFVCSLPVFTLGASTCAMYEVTMRYALHENPAVVRTFFLAFRRCLKKATVIFLIFVGAGLFLVLDLWCAFQWEVQMRFLIVVVILAVCYFYLAVLSHVFPVLMYFDMGVRESIRKAYFLSMSNGVFTVFIMVMNLLPFFLIFLFPYYFGQILFFYFTMGAGGIAFLCSLHLVRLFDFKRAEEADQLEEEQRRLRKAEK